MVKETDVLRAAVQPPIEPRRASTMEMVERIKAEEARAKNQKEPPRGR